MPIIDDTVPDNGETFKLVLSNVSGAKLGDAEHPCFQSTPNRKLKRVYRCFIQRRSLISPQA